jgi:hypothetical protein
MLYYSVVFSLKDAKTNPYLWMYCLLLKSMMQTKTITETDTCYVLADSETKKYLEKYIGVYIQQVEFLEIPTPKTLLEGMLWKYKLHTFLDISNKDCMYLDVDMLSIRTFSPPIPKDTLSVYPEGYVTNPDYCGSWKLNAPCGFSAAFFGYNFGPRVKAFFEKILQLAETTTETFYTLEQPFFNKALENAPYVIFSNEIISPNAHGNMDTCHFINYAGVPGDAYVHWEKALAYFLTFCS